MIGHDVGYDCTDPATEPQESSAAQQPVQTFTRDPSCSSIGTTHQTDNSVSSTGF